MKAAYCTVAVRCIAKFVEERSCDKKGKNVLRRIWSGRILEMERLAMAKSVGLDSDDFLSWMNDVENGVWDVNACQNVLARFEGSDVLEVLHCYVNEEKEKMGPSFIELASEAILKDDALSKIMGLDNNQIKDGAPTIVPAIRQDLDGNAISKSKDNDTFMAHEFGCIPTPEVNRVMESLARSRFELHQVVKDPLPSALPLADSLKANTSGGSMATAHTLEVMYDATGVRLHAGRQAAV